MSVRHHSLGYLTGLLKSPAPAGDGTEETPSCDQGHSICITQSQKLQKASKTHVHSLIHLLLLDLMSKYKLCNESYPHKQKTTLDLSGFSSLSTSSSTNGKSLTGTLKSNIRHHLKFVSFVLLGNYKRKICEEFWTNEKHSRPSPDTTDAPNASHIIK